jgi:hypothetical protein
MVACCSTSPLLQVTAIKKPSLLILERHDRYVKVDANLTTENRAKYLAESKAFTMLLESKQEVRQDEIQPLAIPICLRHDVYVEEDESVDELHRRTFLRSTKILLQVIAEGQ